jgi:hypothetical protein
MYGMPAPAAPYGAFGAQSYGPPGGMMGMGAPAHNPYGQPMPSYPAHNPYQQPPQAQTHQPQHQYGQHYNAGPSGYGTANPYGSAVPSSAPAPAPSPAPAANPWSEHKTDDGNTYWYNSVTGVSQVRSELNIAAVFFASVLHGNVHSGNGRPDAEFVGEVREVVVCI